MEVEIWPEAVSIIASSLQQLTQCMHADLVGEDPSRQQQDKVQGGVPQQTPPKIINNHYLRVVGQLDTLYLMLHMLSRISGPLHRFYTKYICYGYT